MHTAYAYNKFTVFDAKAEPNKSINQHDMIHTASYIHVFLYY